MVTDGKEEQKSSSDNLEVEFHLDAKSGWEKETLFYLVYIIFIF